MACGLVFDSEDEARRHEEQHPGMVRKATGDTAAAPSSQQKDSNYYEMFSTQVFCEDQDSLEIESMPMLCQRGCNNNSSKLYLFKDEDDKQFREV